MSITTGPGTEGNALLAPAEAPGAAGSAVVERVLAGGGETGALMRSIDWGKTPVGPVEAWPQSLRTVIGILLASEHTYIVFWGRDLIQLYNDAYRSILGSTKHPRAMGQSARECWPEIWDVVGPMFDSVFAGGSTHTDDGLLFLGRNGFLEECYFNYAYSPIRGDDGAVAGVFATAIETTARVQGERRLALLRALSIRSAMDRSVAEAYLSIEEVLAHAPLDLPFALLYEVRRASATLVSCAGLTRGAPAAPLEVRLDDGSLWPLGAVARARREVLLDDLGARFDSLKAGAWPEPVTRALVLPLSTTFDGETAAVLVVGLSPRVLLSEEYRWFIQLLAQQAASGIAATRAFEQEKRRAAELAELDRAKTAFFANVSHEFRTPLTLILGPVEEALERADRSLAGESLDLVRRNALRLQKLVNTLLDFSRVETGRAQARYRPTDLGALVADLASAFRSLVERAGLTLTVDCAPLGEPVYVDRDMFEKVVLNLLSNAFKFTLQGGIRVVLAAREGRALLTVADTGVGIPEAELPRVFERFHRVEGARGRSYEGSGIGLALVRELVSLHGGFVSVESRPDEGTRFTVSLPLGRAHLDPARVDGSASPAARAVGALPFLEEASQWSREAPAQRAVDCVAAVGAAAERPRAGAHARVLLADDNADMRSYVHGLLTSQRWAVEAVCDGEAALRSFRACPPDLVLADVMMPGLDGFGLLQALKADEATRAVPVILLSARASEADSIAGVQSGADDYLVKPFSARDLVSRVAARLEIAGVRAASQARERALLEELRIADRRKDELLSELAHELRNPIAAIGLALAVLEGSPVGSARAAGYRATARRQLGTLVRLVDDLLDAARIRHGMAELRKAPEDLAEIVRDAVADARPAIDGRGHALTVVTAPGPFPLMADATRLEQVLVNLLANAVKFTEPGGEITVRLEREEARGAAFSVLRVRDTGRGIPREMLDKVFERFIQAHDAVDRRLGGLGIGLALVKALVEMHGGSVSAHSEGLGRGSEFVVRLPLSEPAASSADAASEAAPPLR